MIRGMGIINILSTEVLNIDLAINFLLSIIIKEINMNYTEFLMFLHFHIQQPICPWMFTLHLNPFTRPVLWIPRPTLWARNLYKRLQWLFRQGVKVYLTIDNHPLFYLFAERVYQLRGKGVARVTINTWQIYSLREDCRWVRLQLSRPEYRF